MHTEVNPTSMKFIKKIKTTTYVTITFIHIIQIILRLAITDLTIPGVRDLPKKHRGK